MSVFSAEGRAIADRDTKAVCVIIGVSGVAGFAVWCGIDLLYVRFLPRLLREQDWIGLTFPLTVFVVALVTLQHRSPGSRIGWSLVAAVASCVLAILLIMFLGIPLHLANGGQL